MSSASKTIKSRKVDAWLLGGPENDHTDAFPHSLGREQTLILISTDKLWQCARRIIFMYKKFIIKSSHQKIPPWPWLGNALCWRQLAVPGY
jgi:hypothetical protein